MTEDEFDILAAKVLAGEATADEATRLQEALAQDAELRAEFAELRATWAALKDVGPLAQALNTPPAEPPPERLRKWHAAVARKRKHEEVDFAQVGAPVRKKLRVSQLCLAAAFLATAIIAGVFLSHRSSGTATSAPIAYLVARKDTVEVRRDGKATAVKSVTTLCVADEIRLSPQASATLITPNGARPLQGPQEFVNVQVLSSAAAATNGTETKSRAAGTALFQPSRQLLGLLVTMRSGQSIPVYSPVGFTANLTPMILWKSEPGKSYDLSIMDEFSTAAPLRRAGVVSPVEFTNAWPGRTLAKDGLYRLRIAENGKPLTTTELTFRTLPQPGETLPADPADKLVAAYEILTANPSRLGDALGALVSLPPEFADSDLALRLKLFAFGQLGYQEDFESAAARLEARR